MATTTVYPRLTDLNNVVESGSNPFTYTFGSGGGTAGGSNFRQKLEDDWQAVFVWNGIDLFYTFDGTAARPDDINLPLFAINIASSDGSVGVRSVADGVQNVRALNCFYEPTMASGDSIMFEKAGRELIVWTMVAADGFFKITHIFDESVTTDLFMGMWSFAAGATYTPVVAYGKTRQYFPDQSVLALWAGNSLTVRTGDDGYTVAQSMRMQFPFLGSRAKFVNCGVDGSQTSDMGIAPQFDAIVAALQANIYRPFKFLYQWELTNSVAPANGGKTTAQALADLATVNTLIKRYANVVIFELTTIPRQEWATDGTAPQTTQNGWLVTMNDAITAAPGAYNIDRIVNMRQGRYNIASPYFEAQFSPISDLYFDAAGVRLHQSTKGINLAATYCINETVAYLSPYLLAQTYLQKFRLPKQSSVTADEGMNNTELYDTSAWF